MPREAFVLAADDLRTEIGGKYIIVGVYTGGIVIPHEEFVVPQLVFLITAVTDINEPFKRIAGEVTLPGAAPVKVDSKIADVSNPSPLARRWITRIPIFIRPAVLRSTGTIYVKILHEQGETRAWGAPLVTLRS
jgi:hypothetical protein